MHLADLKALHTLLAIEHHGSYAAAARTLGITRAAISRAIADAESRLGVQLCRRTTRQVVLTDAARSLLRQIEQPLELVRMALESLTDTETRFSGDIRISVSHAFGRKILLPVLRQFAVLHPKVRLVLSFSDSISSLVATPIDLAVRIGPVSDPNLIARRLRPVQAILCSGPELVAVLGEPQTPMDLLRYPRIALLATETMQVYPWRFKDSSADSIGLPGVGFCHGADSIEAVADLVMAGDGIAPLPPHLVDAALHAGKLCRLLPAFPLQSLTLHLIYYRRDLIPPRVKALIEFIVMRLGR